MQERKRTLKCIVVVDEFCQTNMFQMTKLKEILKLSRIKKSKMKTEIWLDVIIVKIGFIECALTCLRKPVKFLGCVTHVLKLQFKDSSFAVNSQHGYYVNHIYDWICLLYLNVFRNWKNNLKLPSVVNFLSPVNQMNNKILNFIETRSRVAHQTFTATCTLVWLVGIWF